ncbi:MAG: CHASE2 domain-containing protein [Oceanicoccus sp.]
MNYYHVSAPLDNLIYDKSQVFTRTEPPVDLIIVEIDERSILEIGRWPWPRSTHATLLNSLTEGGAAAVGFDIIFSDNDTSNDSSDLRFVQAMKTNGKTILPIHIEQLSNSGQIFEVLPTPRFFAAAAGVGHAHVEHDGDGVCRSVFLKEGLRDAFWPHFSVALLAVASSSELSLPGESNRGKSNSSTMQISRDFHNLIPFRFAPHSFSSVSYIDVINGSIPLSIFNNKTVLIGATATGLSDVINTPVGPIPGVELNAFIYQALSAGDFIKGLSTSVSAILSGLVSLFAVVAISGLAPRSIFMATVLSNVLVVTGSVAILVFFRIWIPPVSAVIAISIFYPLFSWRRLELAVSYLRRELDVLRTEDAGNERKQSFENVILGLNYLSLVLPIKHWQVFSNSNNEKECIYTVGNSRPISRSSDPKTELLIDSIPFSIAEFSFVLEVFWHDIYGKKNKSLLNQLFSKSTENQVTTTWGEGIVEQTIEELNQEKEKSERNSKLAEQTLSQLNEAVIVADICGRIIFVNKEAEQFLHENHEENHLIDLLSPIEINNNILWTDVIKKLLEDGQSFSYEASQDEFSLDFICQGSLLNSEDGYSDTIIVTMTNTSELKKVERDRRDALNFLSHDLQAPMVSVLSIIEQERLDGIDARQSDLLDNIEAHIKKNLGYAENFLQLSRAENISETSFSPCDMYAVMDSAIYQTASFAKTRNISFEHYRCQEDTWVLGNSDLLERAITNLFTNAIKYSDANSKISSRLEIAGDYVYIVIIDQGPGIKASEIDNLFGQFERGSNHDQTGTGLGLYFVKVVASKHKGSIQARSEIGKGSTFMLSLPLFCEDNSINH